MDTLDSDHGFKDAVFITDEYITNGDLYYANNQYKQQNFIKDSIPALKNSFQIPNSINSQTTKPSQVKVVSQIDLPNTSQGIHYEDKDLYEDTRFKSTSQGQEQSMIKAPNSSRQDVKTLEQQWENLPDYVKEEKEDIAEAQQSGPKFQRACETRCLKILILGQSGIGKTTFIKNLFMSYAQDPNFSPRDGSKISWESFSSFSDQILTEVITQEDSKEYSRYQFLIQDTPALQHNSEDNIRRILKYIETQYYQQYLKDINVGETDVSIIDQENNHSIVDLCCYMLPPHQITQFDVESMKRIAQHVPLVPIFAKADSLDPDELQTQRENLYEQLENHGILSFSEDVMDRSEVKVKPCPPFAIVASNQLHPEIPFWPIRKYRWGQCCAFRERDSDLKVFRRLVFSEGFWQVKEASKQLYRKFCQKVHGPLLPNIIASSQSILDQQNDMMNDTLYAKEPLLSSNNVNQLVNSPKDIFQDIQQEVIINQATSESFDDSKYTVATVKELLKKELCYKVVLQIEDSSQRVVRIRIGNPEGQALTSIMYGKTKAASRPLMYDVLSSFLGDAGQSNVSMKLERVVVEALLDSVYYCRIWFSLNGVEKSYDARPSDGFNLAGRLKCPIFVSKEIIRTSSE